MLGTVDKLDSMILKTLTRLFSSCLPRTCYVSSAASCNNPSDPFPWEIHWNFVGRVQIFFLSWRMSQDCRPSPNLAVLKAAEVLSPPFPILYSPSTKHPHCVRCLGDHLEVSLWVKVKVKSLSRVRLFVTPWTVAYQDPPSMRFFQARVLEWVAISFSRGSFQPRDWTWVSCIVGRCFTIWATREATKSLGSNPERLVCWVDASLVPSPAGEIGDWVGLSAELWRFGRRSVTGKLPLSPITKHFFPSILCSFGVLQILTWILEFP